MGPVTEAPKAHDLYALVIYIPDPLGRFLDDLRRELAPDCSPRAHVSVLPPRPLSVKWRIAADEICAAAQAWPAFEVAAGDVRIFQATDVIYLEVLAGNRELHGMHAALNCSALEFQEPFAFHPHITLAQELPRDAVGSAFSRAVSRWAGYSGPRAFHARTAVFVRNCDGHGWTDLAACNLAARAAG